MIRILSLAIFAMGAVVGFMQMKPTIPSHTAATAHQGCHGNIECPIHYTCDAEGNYWSEGHCWK